MTPREMVRLFHRYWRAQRAFSYATRRNIVGIEFGQFGKKFGWSLVRKRKFSGINWVLVPVNITRYFEFSFAHANFPPFAKQCLDASSPALFSQYLAQYRPELSLHVMNPDIKDVLEAKELAEELHLSNLIVENRAIHEIEAPACGFDCIFSISVLEHIAGDYDDSQSMLMLYDLLKVGGRLIVTVPVDSHYWIEYRDRNYYGTQMKEGDQYFFQRFYDRAAIWERLISPTGQEPSHVHWFGEIENGHFHSYIQRWLKNGLDCIVEDPREIADHYREFASWEAMPGAGVCGFVIDKS